MFVPEQLTESAIHRVGYMFGNPSQGKIANEQENQGKLQKKLCFLGSSLFFVARRSEVEVNRGG